MALVNPTCHISPACSGGRCRATNSDVKLSARNRFDDVALFDYSKNAVGTGGLCLGQMMER